MQLYQCFCPEMASKVKAEDNVEAALKFLGHELAHRIHVEEVLQPGTVGPSSFEATVSEDRMVHEKKSLAGNGKCKISKYGSEEEWQAHHDYLVEVGNNGMVLKLPELAELQYQLTRFLADQE